jgi:DNA-directed RNA polymerase sigma subunit (sigma70/sigma32)
MQYKHKARMEAATGTNRPDKQKALVNKYLEGLEREVVVTYYFSKAKSFRETGEILGLKREKCRQVMSKAMRSLAWKIAHAESNH